MDTVLYSSIAWRHPMGIWQCALWASQFGWQAIDARGLSLEVPGTDDRRWRAFGYDMLSPRCIRRSARVEVRERLAELGVPLLGIYCASPVNLAGDLGDRCRAIVADYLQLAVDLGAQWVRPINNTIDAVDGPPMTHQEAYERTVAGLASLAPCAADLGIGLLLENNENTVTPDARSLLQMRTDLGDACQVGLVFDGANAYMQGLDPTAELGQLAGNVSMIHVKNVRRHVDKQWNYVPRGDYSYEWTGLGDGDLDWPALLRQACAAGFDGPVVYEYVNPFKGMPDHYWDTLPEPVDAARNEGAYLQQLVNSLR